MNLFEQHPRTTFVVVFAAATVAASGIAPTVSPVATTSAAAVPVGVEPEGCAVDEMARRGGAADVDDALAWRVPVVHHVRIALDHAGTSCAHDPRG